MASTSTSSIQKSFKYDVFLSFRGEDTRNNFVSHLYKALEQIGIQTYKDDEKIEKGETIDTQLMESIEDSRFFIIVFSKDYAGSSWCLDELVKIMDCRKASEQTAYPVFYDVEPTEVRKQSGAVEEAFKKHENKEAAGKWRKALKEAADLAGWESKKTANGDESKLIQIIVDDIFKKICSSSPSVDRKLVGMETRIEDFLSSLELDAHDVRMIGIWGMGGGGKTTLATTIFNQISHQFEGSSFVDNVREVSNNPLSGLKELQKQILNDIFSDQCITVSSVSGGKNKMVQMMRRKKVLVVLDDVDSTEQLEALASEPDWFKLGSRVIITTRDKQVLSAHGVKFINDVSLLSRAEAISLLSKYAFKRDIPIEGYEKLSKQIVQYADGLPLTIKVLGSLLCGQNVPQWKDTLERLKNIPLKATMEKLELSYNGLEDDYKEIFLDVACFMNGWEKDAAIMALKSCGFFAEAGLRVLEQKSLISISEQKSTYGCLESGRVGMHDHIEEMGKNIVRRLYPNSRLWIQEEIEEILANESGTQATECITLDDPYRWNIEILMNGLVNMKELRFLYVVSQHVNEAKVSNLNFDEDSLHLPNALRFLSWENYPFASFPKTFQAKKAEEKSCLKLRFLSIYPFSSLLKTFQAAKKPFLKLRFLKFYWSNLRTLDLSVAPNLETLILNQCAYLVEVHFQVTPNLKELHIYGCRLEKLHMPAESPNLETLRVSHCVDLVELQIPAECPKLVNLDLKHLKLRTLDLSVAPNLETVILKCCDNLVEVHFQVTPNLKELRIVGCRGFEKLHMPAESPKLRSLELSYLWNLRTLHLGVTQNLETLRVRECNLVELQIPAECPKLVNLDLRKSKLRTLHFGVTANLETLRVRDCADLVELQIPAECPAEDSLHLPNALRFMGWDNYPFSRLPKTFQAKNLVELDMCDSNIVQLWKDGEEKPFSKLRFLKFKYSHYLRTLDLSMAPNLETLILERCDNLVEVHFQVTPNLKELHIYDCHRLEKLHMPAESPKLRSLDFRSLKLRTLHLGVTPNLETLKVAHCIDLVELQIPAECPKLVTLDFCNLRKLRTLHLGVTPNLETLQVQNCIDLVELQIPAECPKLVTLNFWSFCKLRTLHLGVTPNLETLRVRYCADLVEIQIPAECPKLVTLDFCNLRKLRTLHLGVTPNLETLRVRDCADLVEIQIPAECPKLVTLDFCNLRKLRTLHLGVTPNLETLRVSNCADLVELQILAECPKLVNLDLSNCIQVAELPEEIGRLECLKELDITGIRIRHLPESIFRMKGLRIVGSRRRLESCGFASEIKTDLFGTSFCYI